MPLLDSSAPSVEYHLTTHSHVSWWDVADLSRAGVPNKPWGAVEGL